MGRQDAAPVVWYMALSWIVAVAAGTAFGAWRDHIEQQVKKSRATAAQPGA
jgi:elongation factor P hydroxylase